MGLSVKTIQGKAWKFGDGIDIDIIIPARYLIFPLEKMKEKAPDLEVRLPDSLKNPQCLSSAIICHHLPSLMMGSAFGHVLSLKRDFRYPGAFAARQSARP
jgi:3-isopropylmalate dehydratase small subunit